MYTDVHGFVEYKFVEVINGWQRQGIMNIKNLMR